MDVDVDVETETETESPGLLSDVCFVLRTVASCAALAVGAQLMLLAFHYRSVRCDGGCSDDDMSDSFYAVQLAVATVVSVLVVTAVVLGYRRRSAVYYGAATGACVGFVVWLLVIFRWI